MKKISHANRGMGLETLIIYANEQYEKKGIANIRKVSTPWNIIRSGKTIVGAFPEGPSTVDFMGDYQGRSICFEAKSTQNKTSFPLSNFEEHQIEFMRKWKGLAFALIEFSAHKEVYYLESARLLDAWDTHLASGKASIPYEFFKNRCRLVQPSRTVLDYLKNVEVPA